MGTSVPSFYEQGGDGDAICRARTYAGGERRDRLSTYGLFAVDGSTKDLGLCVLGEGVPYYVVGRGRYGFICGVSRFFYSHFGVARGKGLILSGQIVRGRCFSVRTGASFRVSCLFVGRCGGIRALCVLARWGAYFGGVHLCGAIAGTLGSFYHATGGFCGGDDGGTSGSFGTGANVGVSTPGVRTSGGFAWRDSGIPWSLRPGCPSNYQNNGRHRGHSRRKGRRPHPWRFLWNLPKCPRPSQTFLRHRRLLFLRHRNSFRLHPRRP